MQEYIDDADVIAQAKAKLRPFEPEWFDDEDHPETGFGMAWADWTALALLPLVGCWALFCYFSAGSYVLPVFVERTGIAAFGYFLAFSGRLEAWKLTRAFWRDTYRTDVKRAFLDGIKYEQLHSVERRIRRDGV